MVGSGETRIKWNRGNCGGANVHGTKECTPATKDAPAVCRCPPNTIKHDYQLLFILLTICLCHPLPPNSKLKRPHLYIKNETGSGDAYNWLAQQLFNNQEVKEKFPTMKEVKPAQIQAQLLAALERFAHENNLSMDSAGWERHRQDAKPETEYEKVAKALLKERQAVNIRPRVRLAHPR